MDTPQLEQLLSTYYHEDFDIYGGMWGALNQYLVDSGPDDIAQLNSELDAVLRTYNEQEVEALLDSFDCAVYMGDDPGGYRGWLKELARRAADAP